MKVGNTALQGNGHAKTQWAKISKRYFWLVINALKIIKGLERGYFQSSGNVR